MHKGTLEEIAVLIDSGYSVEDAFRLVNGSFEVGSPGLEDHTILVNGVDYKAGLRVNDFGSNPAQFIIHRHSSTLQSAIVGTRSKSDDTSHVNVATGDSILSLIAAGWGTDSYKTSSTIDFKVGTGTVSSTSMPGEIVFATAADGAITTTTALTIDSSQNATFTGNVAADNFTFPATQVTSADANTLDDYEEGTWTPELTGTTETYTAQTGTYTKIGDNVIATFDIHINAIGDASPITYFTGLPFVVGSLEAGVSLSLWTGLTRNVYSVNAAASSGTNRVTIMVQLALDTGNQIATIFGAGSHIKGTVTYKV